MKKVFNYFFYVCFSTIGRINRAWWWFYIFLSNFLYWVSNTDHWYQPQHRTRI